MEEKRDCTLDAQNVVAGICSTAAHIRRVLIANNGPFHSAVNDVAALTKVATDLDAIHVKALECVGKKAKTRWPAKIAAKRQKKAAADA